MQLESMQHVCSLRYLVKSIMHTHATRDNNVFHVMIDLLPILHQTGLDVLDDLRYFANPALQRWPG